MRQCAVAVDNNVAHKISATEYMTFNGQKMIRALENIRRILLNFSELFDIMNEQEQKNLLIYFVKEINLNPHWEKKSPLKSIEFNFPIYEDSEETVFMCEEKSSVKALFVCPKSNFEERFGYLVSVPFLQTGRN